MSRVRELLSSWGLVIGMSARATPFAAFGYTFAFLLAQVSGPVTAIALRIVVDGVSEGRQTGAAWAMALYVAAMVGIDAINTALMPLQFVLLYRGMHALNLRLMQAASGALGVEHLENPAYADQLTMAQSRYDTIAVTFTQIAVAVGVVVTIVVSVVSLAGVHWTLAAVVVLAVCIGAGQTVLMRGEAHAWERSAPGQRLADTLATLVTSPPAAKEMRMFGLGPHLRAEHDRVSREVIRELLRGRRRASHASALSGLARALVLGGGILWLARLSFTGRATVGETVMGVTLLQNAIYAGVNVAQIGGYTIEYGFLSAKLAWLLDYRSPVQPPAEPVRLPAALTDGVRFENVSFRYPGTEKDALHDVSLHLPPGAAVALVGENGAGKTTLVKLLLRLYDPDSGRVLVDGIDLRELDPLQWRSACSGAFQDFSKFLFTARESIGVGEHHDIEREDVVADAAHRGGAAEIVDDLPKRYWTQLGRTFAEGVELSEGQWQRVALSRGLMRGRPLLTVLDEPTAALDPRAEHELFERYAVTAGRDSSVTLLVSHRFSTVRMADLIAVLDDGTVVDAGTHEELMERGGSYAELYALQAAAYQ